MTKQGKMFTAGPQAAPELIFSLAGTGLRRKSGEENDNQDDYPARQNSFFI
ncbi:MAG TPA: hypothetical protein VK857_02935 [Desulforhopalus sp.]|nr:hypothetical protein [Desulforhopalus sp.]